MEPHLAERLRREWLTKHTKMEQAEALRTKFQDEAREREREIAVLHKQVHQHR